MGARASAGVSGAGAAGAVRAAGSGAGDGAAPGTPLTVPSGPRKAGSPPGTMPSSRARRWRASGAE
ncbi:hypothetical protein QR97_27770 [Streptomyces sp. PBH53]|nr:hypothetical protein QR97_27770 [Streptomyces sp. PBH53]